MIQLLETLSAAHGWLSTRPADQAPLQSATAMNSRLLVCAGMQRQTPSSLHATLCSTILTLSSNLAGRHSSRSKLPGTSRNV